MNPRELESLLQDLFDGCIERDGLRLLEEELRTNRSSWDVYRDYVHLEGSLQHRADGIDLLTVIPMDRVIARRQRRYFRNALLGAAAILMLAGVVAALFVISRPIPERLTVSATADAVWSVEGGRSDSDKNPRSVSAGSEVTVPSGTLKLEFDSGARLVIQGPASVAFPALERPVLKHGWLWLDSGGSGVDFEVETPELRVRDVGTRFGVRVPAEGPAEVHLVEGKVEVFDKLSELPQASLEPEGRGFAITASGDSSELSLARDPFPELKELLQAPSNFRTTVLGQSPVGYWRMNEVAGPDLANEVSEGIIGRVGPGIKAGQAGPRPSSGFGGFTPRNAALGFSGSAADSSISLGTTPVHQGIIYREDFEGQGPLHGARPDSASQGGAWMATSSFSKFSADGRFVGMGDKADVRRGGSATLGFEPVDGVVYTLDAAVSGMEGSDGWLAFGFAKGQNSQASKDCRFLGKSVVGRAWMLLTGSTVNQRCEAILGTSGSNGGLADRTPWADWASGVVGDVEVRIVLDTTEGPGKWTATWYAKSSDTRRYVTVRETTRLLNEEISSVGFAVSGGGVSGIIDRFRLRADPEGSNDEQPTADETSADVSLREGAVSLWLRRRPDALGSEVLWAAGRSPEDDVIHARLEPNGCLAFFMENGRYDVLLTSEDGVADDRWHHIVASWSPSAVELYIDGRRVAADTEFRGNQQGQLSELRFGSGPKELGNGPFTGWLDEIAVWSRPLTAIEVAGQFQAAKGPSNSAGAEDRAASDSR